MEIKEQENTTGGSLKIPVPRSAGVTRPSREVSKRDAAASGSDEAGQENNNVGNSGEGESGPCVHAYGTAGPDDRGNLSQNKRPQVPDRGP